MEIELAGFRVAAIGAETTVCTAALTALGDSGGQLAVGGHGSPQADILLVSWQLNPRDHREVDDDALIAAAEAALQQMNRRGRGRIVFLLSAMGAIPMRRHPRYSRRMSAAVAAMRCLSMTAAPEVAVNALGFGRIDGAGAEIGDGAMLTHVPLGRPGRLDEAVAAILFMADPKNSYTTGQLLVVDGGWSTGFGRNF